MTNEQLAIRIQNGETDLYVDLWLRLRPYITAIAKRRLTWIRNPAEVDVDDLIQSGFLALLEAVDDYDPESGFPLTAYLRNHLKTEFNNACGRRSKRAARDPIHNCVSLDVPINPDDPEGLTRLDVLQDPEDMAATVDESVYTEQLRAAEERLLSRMPKRAADVVRALYLINEPVEEIAKRHRTTVTSLSSQRSGYMVRLRTLARTTREGAALRRFIDDNTNFYMAIGPQSFSRTHTSAPEYLTLQREDLEEIYLNRGRRNV